LPFTELDLRKKVCFIDREQAYIKSLRKFGRGVWEPIITAFLALYETGQLELYMGRYIFFHNGTVQHEKSFETRSEAFQYQSDQRCRISGVLMCVGPASVTQNRLSAFTSSRNGANDHWLDYKV